MDPTTNLGWKKGLDRDDIGYLTYLLKWVTQLAPHAGQPDSNRSKLANPFNPNDPIILKAPELLLITIIFAP